MAQREAKLSRKIMDELRANGIFCFKVHGSPHMMSGLPDIIACVDGRFVGLETKVPENANGATKIQLHRHKQIRQSGGHAYVVTSVAHAMHVVGEVRKERK